MPTREPRRRPTISDVALLAGVSKGAVSRSFNGGERISAATIARVHAAAQQLGWAPNTAARAVNGAPVHAVGIVLRRSATLLELDPFFPAFLAGVELVLSAHEYAAVIRFVADAHAERQCYEQMAAERRVDGFLLTDVRQPDHRFAILERVGATGVVVGTPGRRCPYPSVDTESEAQVTALVEHLVAQGHRTIAHVSGVPGLAHAKARQRIWEDTLAAHGLQPGPLAVGAFSADSGARATHEVLAATPRPTAIFYANDVMAIAGLAALSVLGLRAPDDVAVAGFDDIGLSSYTSPPLSTVHCDYVALGRIAAERLLTAVGGGEPERRTTLPAELRLRASTGA